MRNTVVLPLSFLSVVALALAAGCANGNIATAGGAPAPVPSPTAACVLPAGEQAQLVFPIPTQTNSPNLQGIVIAVSPNPLPTNWFFYSTSPSGTTWGTQSIGFLATPGPIASVSPTPLPTPSAAPLFANPIYESASNGYFAISPSPSPSTSPDLVKIYLSNGSCYPGVYMGQFTTATYDIPSPTPSPSPSPT